MPFCKSVIQAVEGLPFLLDCQLIGILHLKVNQPMHTVPQFHHALDAGLGSGTQVGLCHHGGLPIVDLPINNAEGVAFDRGVCRNERILLDFLIQFGQLHALDLAVDVGQGGTELLGKVLILPRFALQLRTIGAGGDLQIAQHHLRVGLEIAVHTHKAGTLLTVLPDIGVALNDFRLHPFRQRLIFPQRNLPFLKEQDGHRGIGPGVRLEHTFRQADRPQQITAPGHVPPRPIILFVHRAAADAIGGNERDHAACPDLINGFGKEVVVDQKLLPVIPLIHRREIAKGDVAYGEVEKAVREVSFLIAPHRNTGLGVELLGDTPGNAVQLYAVQPGRGHAFRQQAEEIAHAAGRLQNIALFKTHLLNGLIDGLDNQGACIMGIEGGGPRRFVFAVRQQAFQFLILGGPRGLVRVKGIGDASPAHIAGQDFLLRFSGGPAVPLDLFQGADCLYIHAILDPRPAYTQVIIGDVKILGGGVLFNIGGLLRLCVFRPVKVQRLDNDIIGQTVFIAGVKCRGSRNCRGARGRDLRLFRLGRRWRGRDLCGGSLRGEQSGVALIMAHCVLEKVFADCLMAPGIRAGVNDNIQIADTFNGAADIVIAVSKSHLVPHLVGERTRQLHAFPLDRLMGKTVQLLQPESAENGSNGLPGQGQLGAEFVLDFHLHADGGCKIVRCIPGLQRHRLGAAGKGEGQPVGNPPVVLAGANPRGNIALVPASQEMLCQHFPKIIVDTAHIGGQIAGNGVISGVQMQ